MDELELLWRDLRAAPEDQRPAIRDKIKQVVARRTRTARIVAAISQSTRREIRRPVKT